MLKESVNEVQLDDIINKFVFITIILAAVLGAASAQTASTPSFRAQAVMTSGSPGSIRAGHILVRFKTTPGQDVLNQLNTAFGAKVVGRIDKIGVTHLHAPSGAGLALLGHLRKRSDVEFAEFDSTVQAIWQANTSAPTTFQPNDPYYSTMYSSSHYGNVDQWGPPAVSAPAAWAVTLNDPGVVIAIVDTGVDDTHPDLASKLRASIATSAASRTVSDTELIAPALRQPRRTMLLVWRGCAPIAASFQLRYSTTRDPGTFPMSLQESSMPLRMVRA